MRNSRQLSPPPRPCCHQELWGAVTLHQDRPSQAGPAGSRDVATSSAGTPCLLGYSCGWCFLYYNRKSVSSRDWSNICRRHTVCVCMHICVCVCVHAHIHSGSSGNDDPALQTLKPHRPFVWSRQPGCYRRSVVQSRWEQTVSGL